jgi:hypothetical protein
LQHGWQVCMHTDVAAAALMLLCVHLHHGSWGCPG